MSSLRKSDYYVSSEEYLAIDRAAEERSEYDDGEMLLMGGASRRHNIIATNITRVLGNQLLERPCEIYAADMRVQIDADARPVEPRRDLLDMRRLARPVIALDHHAAVVREARAHGERRVRVEHVCRVEVGHPLVRLRKGGHPHVDVDPEQLMHAHRLVGGGKQGRLAAVGLGVGQIGHSGAGRSLEDAVPVRRERACVNPQRAPRLPWPAGGTGR